MDKVTYMNLPDCRRLSNGVVELVLTAGVGPRVLRYAFVGGENAFGEWPDASVQTEWGVWRPWGGHRLWAAPEASPRSYSPDDALLEVTQVGTLSAGFAQPADPRTGLAKEMLVELDSGGSGVRVLHRIINRGAWALELAPWALTIMRPGGEVIIPQEPFGPHPEFLLPARPLVLWPYTDLTDARLSLGRRLIRVRPDESKDAPQKIGLLNKQGWAAHLVRGELFVKTYAYAEGAAYPDYNCNTQVFTASAFVELESLAPLTRLEPGGVVEHEERWALFGGVETGSDEESVEAAVAPLALGARRTAGSST